MFDTVRIWLAHASRARCARESPPRSNCRGSAESLDPRRCERFKVGDRSMLTVRGLFSTLHGTQLRQNTLVSGRKPLPCRGRGRRLVLEECLAVTYSQSNSSLNGDIRPTHSSRRHLSYPSDKNDKRTLLQSSCRRLLPANTVHNQHTECLLDQFLSGFERGVIAVACQSSRHRRHHH
jgi:hypothetical protein